MASAGLVAAGLLVSSPTTANPGASAPEEAPSAEPQGGHEPKHPLKIKEKRDAQKEAALERIMRGKSPFPDGGKGQTVPLEVEGTDRVFVVLAEFGNERYPGAGSTACGPGCFTDTPPFNLPDPEPTTFDGPLHNQIPEPDRSVDNSTIWKDDFDVAHYEDMYFNRMREYYKTQSSGRYDIEGDVTEWVKVPYNQALYGRGFCGNPLGTPVTTCASTKALIRDAMAVWVKDQLDSGQTMAQIQDYLKTFDIEDRYDIDADNNYREPDGFIDHFQIVHAGGDEAASDPIYGTDAIWSHRWYSNLQAGGPGGLTGVNIGSNTGAYGLGATPANPVPNNPTGVWVGDYTIQPENGGLGVFAHEYAHDLGLPDLYDTSGNLGGGENSTGFWTLMSSGSNIGDGGDTTGDAPVDMGVWELLQLGWLEKGSNGGPGPFYELLQPGERKEVRLGNNTPATTGGAQALITRLPDLTRDRPIGTPFAGTQMFWSTEGNNLETTMTKTGITGTNLTAKVDHKIEVDWDYAYLEASSDTGATWQIVPTNRSTNGDPNQQNEGNGITGNSGGWVDLTATLPAGTNAVRFRYWTDVAAVERGIFIDNIAIDGQVIGSAETDEGWVFDGFKQTTGTETEKFLNAYIAENRQYDGYDSSLKTAYNFGWLQTQPDRVQHFPYQNGVLINYWNTMYSDNNVSTHPGAGEILPIDAHPTLTHWSDGTLMRPRFLSYDSTFGNEATDAISLQEEYRVNGGPVQTRTGTVPSQKAVPVFDDRLTWWYGSDEHGGATHPGRYKPGWYSVNPPKTGTTMRVEDFQGNGTVKVRVNW